MDARVDGDQFFNIQTLIWLLIGSSLVYAGGCFLNDACDHQFDQKHRPERPIPSRLLSLAQVWTLGIIQLGLGVLALIKGQDVPGHGSLG